MGYLPQKGVGFELVEFPSGSERIVIDKTVEWPIDVGFPPPARI